jgi:CubicO group peptidase (beta-lactamase class C family)
MLPERWVQQAMTRHARGVAQGWDYGYQWWITSHAGVEVWAGRGFGAQFLLVIPARGTVAVVYGWNVFGTPARGIVRPLIETLVAP